MKQTLLERDPYHHNSSENVGQVGQFVQAFHSSLRLRSGQALRLHLGQAFRFAQHRLWRSVEHDVSSEAIVPDHEWLDQLTDALCRHGLRLPALIVLEAGRPMAFLSGQLLWVAQPALSLFFSSKAVYEMAQLLEEPAAVEALMTRLEARES